MKKLLISGATFVALKTLKPIERLPKVGGFAPEIEAVIGVGGIAMGYAKKAKNEYVKGAIQGFAFSGVNKLVDKYVPQA